MFYTASKYFVVVLCVLLCSGCLLDRLVGSKKELCADRIELGEVTEEGASIIFIKPILWNSDIIKIIGEKPTRIIPEFITPQSKKLEYHYRIVREGDDPQGEYSFNTVFHFEKKENIFKLARVDIDKNIKDVLSVDLIKQVMRAGCEVIRKGYSIRVDLSGIDRHKLPKKDQVIAALGSSHEPNAKALVYNYKTGSSDTAEIRVSFAGEPSLMSSVEVTYFRYKLHADFVGREGKGSIRSWRHAAELSWFMALSW